MSQNVFSTYFDLNEEPILRKKLERQGFKFCKINYAFWQAKKDALSITFFNSGKLLIQGWGADRFATKFLAVREKINGLEHIENLESWIGTDESGKGDFFGPLTVAAVFVTREKLKDLILLEVQDSKSISDKKILTVAQKIKAGFSFATITIKPDHYNQLYQQYKNLNQLLAGAHAQAIERILNKVNCRVVLSDKFGDEALISNALLKKGRHVSLVQQTKAETNPAVAAASIIARAEFLNYLAQLSRKYKIDFPRGCSNQVIQTGKLFAKKYGLDQLEKVAKLHFKTYKKIIT